MCAPFTANFRNKAYALVRLERLARIWRFTDIFVADKLKYKISGRQGTIRIDTNSYIYEDDKARFVINPDYPAQHGEFKKEGLEPVDLKSVSRMAILIKALQGLAPLSLQQRT